MARAGIHFQSTRAPNFSAANELLGQATDTVSGGVEKVQDIFTGISAKAKSDRLEAEELKTDDLVVQMMQAGSEAELRAIDTDIEGVDKSRLASIFGQQENMFYDRQFTDEQARQNKIRFGDYQEDRVTSLANAAREKRTREALISGSGMLMSDLKSGEITEWQQVLEGHEVRKQVYGYTPEQSKNQLANFKTLFDEYTQLDADSAYGFAYERSQNNLNIATENIEADAVRQIQDVYGKSIIDPTTGKPIAGDATFFNEDIDAAQNQPEVVPLDLTKTLQGIFDDQELSVSDTTASNMDEIRQQFKEAKIPFTKGAIEYLIGKTGVDQGWFWFDDKINKETLTSNAKKYIAQAQQNNLSRVEVKTDVAHINSVKDNLLSNLKQQSSVHKKSLLEGQAWERSLKSPYTSKEGVLIDESKNVDGTRKIHPSLTPVDFSNNLANSIQQEFGTDIGGLFKPPGKSRWEGRVVAGQAAAQEAERLSDVADIKKKLLRNSQIQARPRSLIPQGGLGRMSEENFNRNQNRLIKELRRLDPLSDLSDVDLRSILGTSNGSSEIQMQDMINSLSSLGFFPEEENFVQQR